MGKGPTPAVEEYLEAIHHLREIEDPVRPARVAERLKVSSAAVAMMLARLEREGLIERSEDRGIRLNRAGQRLAASQVTKHRLAERLLHDLLGLRWDQVHDEACKLEHALSPAAVAGLEGLLHNPKTCPHGNPIPDLEGTIEEPPSCSLAELVPGESAVIVKITEEESAMLGQLLSLGLLPDAVVTVEEIAPFHGPLLVRVGSSRYALGRDIAARIRVGLPDGAGLSSRTSSIGISSGPKGDSLASESSEEVK